MKIRTDFVTNSSSSSFVVLNITSKTFSEIIEKYKEELIEEMLEICPEEDLIDGDTVNLFIEEGYCDIPTKLNEVVRCLATLFSHDVDEDEETGELIIEDYQDDDEDNFYRNIAKDIIKNKEAIEEDLVSVSWEYDDIGYGGDSDLRYYEDQYPKERLTEIKEEIASEKGISVEDVTEEDFSDYVGDKTSHDTENFKYDKETGEESYSKDFYVE